MSNETVAIDRRKKYTEADLLEAFYAGKNDAEFFYDDFLRDYNETHGIDRHCTSDGSELEEE